MGVKEDLERFKEVGEKKRQDLKEFIKQGKIQSGGGIKVPIKVVELPEFQYDQLDKGGVGSGDGDVGDPVPNGDGEQEGDSDEPGEESEGERGHYEMNPEEFAEELDEELGLDLEPKGKKLKEKTEGALVELARSGPDSTLDFDRMFKRGLKRTMAMFFDEEFLREVMRVNGMGVSEVFEWARGENIPVSKEWIANEYENIEETDKYSSVEEIGRTIRKQPYADEIESVALREEDKRHKHPEITKEYEKSAVVVFIRDVSGSMRQHKRELVERIFTPLDWYLTGKYENAEFVYIAHDSEAWTVDKNEFFGIKSGGGTRISSAYELCQEILNERYPWEEWNRYVIASGDGENAQKDSSKNVVPLMKEIDANLHAYLEVKNTSRSSFIGRGDSHADIIKQSIGNRDNVAVAYAEQDSDAINAIEKILSTEDS